MGKERYQNDDRATAWRKRQEAFYKSPQWQALREAVMSERGRLCERCLKNGIYRPADVVHHIKHVTQFNINDPSVTLNSNNLICLCVKCHAEVHHDRRFTVDQDGHVII